METQVTIAEANPYIASNLPPEILTAPISMDPLIDDGAIRKRIRRPLDLARFVVAVALASGTITLGYFATTWATGLKLQGPGYRRVARRSDPGSAHPLRPRKVILVTPGLGFRLQGLRHP